VPVLAVGVPENGGDTPIATGVAGGRSQGTAAGAARDGTTTPERSCGRTPFESTEASSGASDGTIAKDPGFMIEAWGPPI
jgi:hypothetical protein